MDVARASFTALATCYFRAVHRRCDPEPLIDDSLGDRLLSPGERELLLDRLLLTLTDEERDRVAAEAGTDRALDCAVHLTPGYGGVLARARYVEDLLVAGLARGRTRYLALGAGFDSVVQRRPDLAERLEVIEVDHPATQRMKRDRLASAGCPLPAGVRLVEADLSQDALSDVLTAAGADRERETLVAWLGVAPYLSEEANLAIFSALGRGLAPGSEIAFDYLDRSAFAGATRDSAASRMQQERSGTEEAFLSSFEPSHLARELEALGIEIVEDLGPREVEARYCEGRQDGLRLRAPGRIALARVTGSAAEGR